MIAVNGTELPAPTTYTPGIQDISKASRNAAGTMIIERVTTKRKISLSWNVLSGDDTSTILTLVSSVSFSVEYLDPQTNAFQTGIFYCGDRTVDGIVYSNGKMTYKNLKFDIIEL